MLHVAVSTRVAILAMPGDEVDAWPPAQFGVPQAALAGQQREELRQRRLVRDLTERTILISLGAHGTGTQLAGVARGSGRLILLEVFGQVRGLLRERAHIAAHSVLFACGLQAEAWAPHRARRGALGTCPGSAHVLVVLDHVNERVLVRELKGHAGNRADACQPLVCAQMLKQQTLEARKVHSNRLQSLRLQRYGGEQA